MMVAGASVPSTVPRQMHMSDFMSTLVRVIVRAVFSLSSSTIFVGSLEGGCAVASLVSAYSTIPARGGSIMLIPVAALEVMAWAIMAFCSSLMLVRAGIVRNTWFQSA